METTHLTPKPQNTVGTQPLPRWPAWGDVLSRLAAFLGLAALLLLLGGAALVAHAAISPSKATASHSCRATQVILHGTKAPAVSCLDGKQGTVRTLTRGGSGPLARQIQLTGCDDDALVLYWNSISDVSNKYLCINGGGVMNLTVVGWNDVASAWWTGCYHVIFYVDINQAGNTAYAPGAYDGEYAPWGNFPYQNVPNDSLSSMYLFAPKEETIALPPDTHRDVSDEVPPPAITWSSATPVQRAARPVWPRSGEWRFTGT